MVHHFLRRPVQPRGPEAASGGGLSGAVGVRRHGRAHGATAQAGRGRRGGHGGGARQSVVRTGGRGGAGRSPDAHGARADRAASVSRLGRGRHGAAGGGARGLRHSGPSREGGGGSSGGAAGPPLRVGGGGGPRPP